MKRFLVVVEVVIAVFGVLALVAMGGGWTVGVSMLCIAGAIGVVINRRDLTPPLTDTDLHTYPDSSHDTGDHTGDQ